ncbi:MAG TPA: AbrB/MazE/SpoVT family DNA-binding domain-containing protein [Chloroflexota bacterium]|nr:AbrB/MazE/SpoVT family DNA-binding domain-containing protein [Chloroflexota bacterium]
MDATDLVTEVRVGPQGRIVIPASLRRAAGIKPGDSLTARLDEGRLVLERRADVVTRLRRRFAGASGVSLAEKLLRERREEARRDVSDEAGAAAPAVKPAKRRRGTHEP